MMCAEDLSKSKGTAGQNPAPLSQNRRRIRDDWVDNNGLVIASNWPSPNRGERWWLAAGLNNR